MQPHKALFLDRDGVINIDYGYVSTQEQFHFSEGIFELVRLFEEAGYWIFVITNQSGIGRGYYTQEAFHQLSAWMCEVFQEHGITIQAVEYCPHHPDAHCHCRKPNTGMIEHLTARYPIDLAHSWLIGDKPSDIALANHAGIGGSIAIGSTPIPTSTLHFESITACYDYIQHNRGRL